MEKISGSVFTMGDDINTDVIIPGRYLIYTEQADLAKYAFEPLGEEFRTELGKHQILVAGENFGCGSAREQGATAIKAMGIKAIIGKSFARTFFRNAINSGLAAIDCGAAVDAVKTGDLLTLDINNHQISDGKRSWPFSPFAPEIAHLLESGGLLPFLRRAVEARKG